MASPVDATRAATNISTAADPWTVTMPASIAAGDLLLMFLRCASFTLQAGVSGWTSLDQDTSDASDDESSFWWKAAVGGDTVSPNFSTAVKGGCIIWRITGAEDPTIQPPELVALNGTTANADPSSITPAGGSKDYLFLVALGMDGETQTLTLPANYTNSTPADSGTGGAAASNVRMNGGTRQLTASSENPGAWTSGAPTNGFRAYTVAIHPPTAPADPMVHRTKPIIVGGIPYQDRSRW